MTNLVHELGHHVYRVRIGIQATAVELATVDGISLKVRTGEQYGINLASKNCTLSFNDKAAFIKRKSNVIILTYYVDIIMISVRNMPLIVVV